MRRSQSMPLIARVACFLFGVIMVAFGGYQISFNVALQIAIRADASCEAALRGDAVVPAGAACEKLPMTISGAFSTHGTSNTTRSISHQHLNLDGSGVHLIADLPDSEDASSMFDRVVDGTPIDATVTTFHGEPLQIVTSGGSTMTKIAEIWNAPLGVLHLLLGLAGLWAAFGRDDGGSRSRASA